MQAFYPYPCSHTAHPASSLTQQWLEREHFNHGTDGALDGALVEANISGPVYRPSIASD